MNLTDFISISDPDVHFSGEVPDPLEMTIGMTDGDLHWVVLDVVQRDDPIYDSQLIRWMFLQGWILPGKDLDVKPEVTGDGGLPGAPEYEFPKGMLGKWLDAGDLAKAGWEGVARR